MSTIKQSLKTLFRKEPEMNSTQQEAETAAERFQSLQLRFTEVRSLIAAGELSEELILEESDLRERVLAAERVRDATQAKAHKERIAGLARDFDRRADVIMTEIGGLIPELLFVLGDLENLIAEGMNSGAGSGRTMDQILGVPQNFATEIKRAIGQAAPRTQWNYDVCVGGKAQRPVTSPEPRYALPMAAGSPPLNYSGAWSYLTGPVKG